VEYIYGLPPARVIESLILIAKVSGSRSNVMMELVMLYVLPLYIIEVLNVIIFANIRSNAMHLLNWEIHDYLH
jgi:hypothetical protein